MEVLQQSARETVEAVEGVHLTQLAVGDKMSVQHFHFEPGAVVPEHSHHHEQVGYLIRGALAFPIDSGGDDPVEAGGDASGGDEWLVGPGDSYCIPGDEPHAAENRTEDPVEGIDIFGPPRANPDWMD